MVEARLRAAGAIPIVRPCGGGNGGDAALVAARGSPLGLASDAAGCLRLSAAFSGIAALKPTSGRVPHTGHVPPAGGWIEALWQIGPMARSVDDLRTAMALLAGVDGCDPSVMDMGFPDPWEMSLGRLRVAWYTDNGIAAASPEVAPVVRAAADSLEDNAAAVEEARPACLERAYDLEMKLLGADGGDALRGAPPFLSAWLDRLPPYRTDLAGLRSLLGGLGPLPRPTARLPALLRRDSVPRVPRGRARGRPARLQPHHGLQRSRVARRRGALRRDGRRPAHRGADRRAALERRHRAGRGWRSRRTVRRLEGAGPVESASAISPRRGRTPARAKTDLARGTVQFARRLPRLRNLQIVTDLAGQKVVDFAMAGHG